MRSNALFNIGFSRRALLAGLAAVSAIPARAEDTGEFSPTEPPMPVPEILFSNVNGTPLQLSDYRGKAVLLNIWATWCVPCVVEMPSLAALQARLGPEGLVVLPVSMDRGKPDKIEKFYADNHITGLPVLLNRELSVSRQLKPRGLPLSLLIDKNGMEVARALGGVDWMNEAVIARIRKFL